MSKKSAYLFTVFSVVGYVLLVVLAATVSLDLIFFAFMFAAFGFSVTMIWVDAGSYTNQRDRAMNAQRLALQETRELLDQASRCYKLARTYCKRDQPYDAEILKIEGDHKRRQAELRVEDAERIQRELDDREMIELMKSER